MSSPTSLLTGSTLSGLATFNIAARYGSFTQAAEHLHITTGAVSQQIRQLEQQLNLTLFERHSRGIRLTDKGQQLYQVVSQSLHDISDTLSQLQQPDPEGEVRLKLTPSFAYKWLVPRLQDFYQQYPEINIQIFAEGALVDHQDTSVDLVIDYCRQPHTSGTLLMSEYLLPVMSPAYRDKFDWQAPKCWEQVVLLHDAMPWRDARADYEWHHWFQKMGLQANSQKGHYFNRTDMAMAAAEAGLGVAMARGALLHDDLSCGKLVSPFEAIPAKAGYYLIQHRQGQAIQCFINWLCHAAREQAPSPTQKSATS
ncbi:LysR substrate-binding domain-containing protein [Photobacterium atrarenae]|uniref:LysR substrate-binding domain-containing protein n=1 Tax=Photobacterium atrarenae TaxID=865757 RepID=A0ABY5GPV9_9GAMM|nr:LysR substrate-binding domain-containing protein [Photobacterium atrarenae]UTV30699.1 LysR substrate-binding domain-containing protein [Photobacterium atrarenae]